MLNNVARAMLALIPPLLLHVAGRRSVAVAVLPLQALPPHVLVPPPRHSLAVCLLPQCASLPVLGHRLDHDVLFLTLTLVPHGPLSPLLTPSHSSLSPLLTRLLMVRHVTGVILTR